MNYGTSEGFGLGLRFDITTPFPLPTLPSYQFVILADRQRAEPNPNESSAIGKTSMSVVDQGPEES